MVRLRFAHFSQVDFFNSQFKNLPIHKLTNSKTYQLKNSPTNPT